MKTIINIVISNQNILSKKKLFIYFNNLIANTRGMSL